MNNSPYYYISKYRLELMGIAIFWVVWFHSHFLPDFIPIKIVKETTQFIKNIGYGGVDLFLLVSGMGIYNSLEKNSISTYIKNRQRKILPVWWTYIVIFVTLGVFIFNISYSRKEILGLVTLTGFWLDMEHQGNWYVYAIMLIYLISPVIFSLIKDSRNKTKTTLFIVALSVILSFSFFYHSKLILFSRVPTYVIGMYLTAHLKNYTMTKRKWICCIIAFFIGLAILIYAYYYLSDYLWDFGLWWYPFIIIAPTMALIICKLIDVFQKHIKWLSCVLRQMGQSSLEILLISNSVYKCVSKFSFTTIPMHLVNFGAIVMGIVLGCLFHIIVEYGKLYSAKIFKKINIVKAENIKLK